MIAADIDDCGILLHRIVVTCVCLSTVVLIGIIDCCLLNMSRADEALRCMALLLDDVNGNLVAATDAAAAAAPADELAIDVGVVAVAAVAVAKLANCSSSFAKLTSSSRPIESK